MPAQPDRFEMLLAQLRALRKLYGYSTFDRGVRLLNRERLEDGSSRAPRRSYSWGEYKRLYEAQRGKCPLCGHPMVLLRGEVHMDHKDPNAADFDSRHNRQVVHKGCNLRKGPDNLIEYTKRSSRTVRQMLDYDDNEVTDL